MDDPSQKISNHFKLAKKSNDFTIMAKICGDCSRILRITIFFLLTLIDFCYLWRDVSHYQGLINDGKLNDSRIFTFASFEMDDEFAFPVKMFIRLWFMITDILALVGLEMVIWNLHNFYKISY